MVSTEDKSHMLHAHCTGFKNLKYSNDPASKA